MGQQLFKVNFERVDSTKSDAPALNSDVMMFDHGKDGISFFFPHKSDDTMRNSVKSNNDHQISSSQIRNHLFQFTNSIELEEIDTEINEILMENVFSLMEKFYGEAMKEITDNLETQEKLQKSLMNKFKQEEYEQGSIFAPNENPLSTEIEDGQQKSQLKSEQISTFAVQSLISILLILIKSSEKNDSTIVHQILSLTSQLCEQIPMRCLSSSNQRRFLLKSFKPLINYIEELSLSSDSILAKQAIKILLSFSIAKASFKDVLSLLSRLIFDTDNVYDVQSLFIQLNNDLTETNDQQEQQKQMIDTNSDLDQEKGDDTTSEKCTEKISSISLDYLKSLGVFPNSKLIELNEKQVTGQFLSSIILAHVDFDNEIHSNKQFKDNLLNDSFSFGFHPKTFKQLFNIIEQLSRHDPSNTIINYILIFSIRLFTTHLKFLSAIKTNLHKDLLSTNDEIRKVVSNELSQINNDIDLTRFVTNEELTKWFQLFLQLASCNNEQIEQKTISQEASKALIYIIDKLTSSFTDKLLLIHKYIMKNEHQILIKELFIELIRKETLLKWIEVLCQNNSDKAPALNILFSFIDICFNIPINMNEEQKQQIQQILLSFQHLLLFRLVPQSRKQNPPTDESVSSTSTYSLIIEYIAYIFKNHIDHGMIENELFNEILVGLSLMTKTEEIFHLKDVQPIFAAFLPLLGEYLLKNTTNDLRFISWILGKMSHIIIVGPPFDSLKEKNFDQLKSPLFAGGCEKLLIENNSYLLDLINSNLSIYSQFQLTNQPEESLSNKQLLISISKNSNEGAQLISKMKMSLKDKHHLLQKSIEEQANDACAAIFAVYIKYYRRINLVQYDLSRTDQEKAHKHLLSLYEHAKYVRILFSTIKAQGGDCNELYEQIQNKTSFLLSSVKENDLIPIIEEDLPEIIEKKGSNFQRQVSRWSKAKNIIRLLRNLMKACIRFKKLILAKKKALQQIYNSETTLNQSINSFIYGNFYKLSTSTSTDEKQLELDEIEKYLCQQHERAMTRFVIYRFIETFIQNICNLKNQNQVLTSLTLYFGQLRNPTLEWSYSEDIPAVNSQLKKEIRKCYYSIIKIILSYLISSPIFQSEILVKTIFNLLNLCYEPEDIFYLYDYQIAETLFKLFVSFENSERTISLDLKFTAFNWFRLFTLKVCETIYIEELKGLSTKLLEKQREIIFHRLLLNQLKGFRRLKQTLPIDTNENSMDSLKNINISCFIHAKTKVNSNQFEIELCTNQFLILLLECVHFYEHLRPVCANIDYIEELLDIYHHSKHNGTILIALKILRQLISYLPESNDGTSNHLIEEFLVNILLSIGESFTSQRIATHTVNELIYIYRTIMSVKSPWQIIATQFVLDSIQSTLNIKSLESNDTRQINTLLSSLCILGGYIQPFSLGSIVRVSTDKEMSDESQLAMIIEIERNDCDSNITDASPYVIQYLKTNQIESVTIDQLQIETDVPPPNLLLLLNMNNSNLLIHSLLDTLGHFIEIDTSTNTSALLLQIKRRSISVLYHLLNNQTLVEIFMQKSYASAIAKLTMSDSIPKQHRQPPDLRLFNRQHVEQYCLSLDNCQRFQQILENKMSDTQNRLDNAAVTNDQDDFSSFQINRDQRIIDALSTSVWKYNGWKPYAYKTELQLFKQGRIGNNEISIVPMPRNIANAEALKECGNKHRFKGNISPSSDNTNVRFPTFILENLQVNEGKWYFCVKLLVAGPVQIGWATDGFSPGGSHGIGNDLNSWSYDGSRATFFHNRGFRGQFNDIRWKENDVCGCGIDIDGENINIKYWLNGKLLGTAFSHQSDIPRSSTECNLLPNGISTTYFPGISLTSQGNSPPSCELIFSPEDMDNCPLPHGYKPLLLPELINIENSIVAYPNNAYLVGDNLQDYFYTTRTTTSKIFLRDFVNKHHLKTEFSLNEHQLILPENSAGFPLSIDNDVSSFTITFDFQISTNEEVNIRLLTFDTFSLEIPMKKPDEKTRTVIVFYLKEREIKVYINNKCQIFNMELKNETMSKLNIHLLPNITAGISDLAIWKYALPDEQIQRLFTYGLFYVSIDYQQLKEHRKQANTFSFTQEHQFDNELLVPFDQPFEEEIWEKKKKEVEQDESKYFQSSAIQFYGNKTYLVLDKSIKQWSEYILILDISIPNWPINNEQLSLVTLNSKTQIFVTNEGKLCLQSDQTRNESSSSLSLNEYFRLFISVEEQCVKIYINELLVIDDSVDDDRFAAKLNRIDLFRETDLTKNNNNEETLRILCQSITFLNRSLVITDLDEQIKLPNSSLETLISPSFSQIASSLIAIGYNETWIQSVIEEQKITNIQMIDTILREQKEQFIKIDLDNEQKRYLKIVSRLSSSIDEEKLKNSIISSKFDTEEQIEFILTHWDDLQTMNKISDSNEDKIISEENKWFWDIVHDLDIHHDINKWIRDKSIIIKKEDNPTINLSSRVTNWYDDDDDDDDDDPQSPDIFHMLRASRNEETESNPFGNVHGDTVYKLLDLTEHKQTTIIQNQRKSIQYSHQNISREQFLNFRIACEHALTIIYTRYTIENILKVWSNNSITLFPLEKFGDYTFLVSLIRIMDYHFIYTSSYKDENIDQISLLIKSILKTEIQQILENIASQQSKAPLFFQLRKNVIGQLIRFLMEPTLLDDNSDNETILDEQMMIKQSNLNFVFKILNLFVELIKDKSILKQNQIDLIIPILFTEPLINLIFDLFLLVPTHQAKIFILHLFSTLIQRSERFNLKIQIQNFLFQLLIELSSNTASTKHFQMAVMDLVYLLLMREEKQRIVTAKPLYLQRAKLPENIQDLFTVIDVINALTDKTKQTSFPETFFVKSDELKLNQDDFQRCHIHFDIIADQQLINFMNKNPLVENSFADFIVSLPNESVPNATYYQNYPSLTNIPADCVQIRAKFFYQFNFFLVNILPMVDLSLLSEQNFLTDQIRIAKIYFLQPTKFQLFNESLKATTVKQTGQRVQVKFDTLEVNDSYENTIFHQAYQQLHADAHINFRKMDRQIWYAVYVGMHSVDQGGPYRDSITQMCSDICSTRLPLFILCPNGRTNSGLNKDCWIPNVFPPNQPIPNELKNQYRFIGQLMGMAIRKKHFLDLKFPLLFWKQLLREPITIEDIQAIDIQSFTIIYEMEKNIEQTKLINVNTDINDFFSSIMSELRFEIVSSAGQTYELIPGGMEIPITVHNFKQYCFSYRQYRLNEFYRQIEFIRQGLFSVVPSYFLTLFTADELEQVVCGTGRIDIELLKRHTRYSDDFNQDSPHIQRFWTVFTEMFDNEQRKLFLTFVWGRNTLPIRDEDFTMKFTINEYDVYDGDLDKALPRSHTCFFTIDLPEYSTTEIMYERLTYAITYCSSIDGDDNINEIHNTTDSDSD